MNWDMILYLATSYCQHIFQHIDLFLQGIQDSKIGSTNARSNIQLMKMTLSVWCRIDPPKISGLSFYIILPMTVAIKLVGGLEHEFYFSIQLGIVTPTDFYIFQRGRSTQPPTRILLIIINHIIIILTINSIFPTNGRSTTNQVGPWFFLRPSNWTRSGATGASSRYEADGHNGTRSLQPRCFSRCDLCLHMVPLTKNIWQTSISHHDNQKLQWAFRHSTIFIHFHDDHWSFRWPLGHLDDHFTTQKTRVPLRKGSATAARFRQLGIMAPQSWLKWLMTCYAFKMDNFILQYKQNIIYNIYIYNIISIGYVYIHSSWK